MKQIEKQFILDQFLKGSKACQAYAALRKKFGDQVCSIKTVHGWYRKFRTGELSIEKKPRSGRPLCVDYEELQRDVLANPNQSVLEMARKFQCSTSVVRTVLKKYNFVHVDSLWIKSVTEEEKPQSPKTEIKEEIVEKELKLEQKIYIVIKYYESGRTYDTILKDFDEKFNVKSTENLLESLKSVIEMFATSGSVKEEDVFYNALELIDIGKEGPENNFETVMIPDLKEIKEDSDSSMDLPSSPKKKTTQKRIVKSKTIISIYPRECPICKRSVSNTNFHNHVRGHQNIDSHFCEICNKGFKLRRYLKRHMEFHKPASERKSYICQICGVNSTPMYNHKKHMKTAHPELSID